MAATIVVRIRAQINVPVQTIPVLWLRVKVMHQGVVTTAQVINLHTVADRVIKTSVHAQTVTETQQAAQNGQDVAVTVPHMQIHQEIGAVLRARQINAVVPIITAILMAVIRQQDVVTIVQVINLHTVADRVIKTNVLVQTVTETLQAAQSGQDVAVTVPHMQIHQEIGAVLRARQTNAVVRVMVRLIV